MHTHTQLLVNVPHPSMLAHDRTQDRGASSPYAAAVDEQRALLARHGNGLSMEVLSEMETLHMNIQEALRMHPPLLLVMRYAKTPFSVTTRKGTTYTVPVVRASAAWLGCFCGL